MLKQIALAAALAVAPAVAESQVAGYVQVHRNSGTHIRGAFTSGYPFFNQIAVPRYIAAGFPYHPGCNVPVPVYQAYPQPIQYPHVPQPQWIPVQMPASTLDPNCEIVKKEADKSTIFVGKSTVKLDGNNLPVDCGLECGDNFTLYIFRDDKGETEVIEDKDRSGKRLVIIHKYDKSSRELEEEIPEHSTCDSEYEIDRSSKSSHTKDKPGKSEEPTPIRPLKIRVNYCPEIRDPHYQSIPEAMFVLSQVLPENCIANSGRRIDDQGYDIVVSCEGIPPFAFEFPGGIQPYRSGDSVVQISTRNEANFVSELLDGLVYGGAIISRHSFVLSCPK